MSTQTAEVPQTNAVVIQEPNLIEQVLMVIENSDPNYLESTKQIEKIDLRRNEIAQHFIDVAKTLGVLKRSRSVSTMRQKIYDVINPTTKASKAIYHALSMKADILDNVKNLPLVLEATQWKVK